MNTHASKKQTLLQPDLELKDSLTVLGITFSVAVLFAVLLCYYPGKDFLGNNFWPLFALPALLAAGTGIKMLVRKTIIAVNGSGIRFYRSGTFISWENFIAARIKEEIHPDSSTEEQLIIQYYDNAQTPVEISFHLTGAFNRTGEEILEAIRHFQNNS